ALPRPAPLRRAAATAQLDQTASRLKITIGDRVVDGLDEDGVYALTYVQVAEAVGSGIVGTPVGALRLFAGPKDTLSVGLAGPPVASNLREVPLDVRDANGNGTFDAGDSILFYAHGTSIWKPVPGATGPVLWEFKSDPWSFENRYYLQW